MRYAARLGCSDGIHWNDVVLGVADTGDLCGQRIECLPLLGSVLIVIVGALHTGDDVPEGPLRMVGLHARPAHQ